MPIRSGECDSCSDLRVLYQWGKWWLCEACYCDIAIDYIRELMRLKDV